MPKVPFEKNTGRWASIAMRGLEKPGIAPAKSTTSAVCGSSRTTSAPGTIMQTAASGPAPNSDNIGHPAETCHFSMNSVPMSSKAQK